MAVDPGKLLEEALKLAPEARAALAAALLDSLDPDQGADKAAEAAWATEIARRVRELDTGVIAPIPRSEARRKMAAVSIDPS